MSVATASESSLREQIIQLGPWHQKVQITPTLSTAAFLEAPKGLYEKHGPVAFIDDHDEFHEMMKAVYPKGVAGKV